MGTGFASGGVENAVLYGTSLLLEMVEIDFAETWVASGSETAAAPNAPIFSASRRVRLEVSIGVLPFFQGREVSGTGERSRNPALRRTRKEIGRASCRERV